MNLPQYLYSENFTQQQLFFELMFQQLNAGLSDNGWTVPQVTDAFLTSIAPFMPNGTLWYVTDATPDPVFVGKINGTLNKFTTTAYP